MKRKLLKWTAFYLGTTYSLERGLGGNKYMHKKWFDKRDILVGDDLFHFLSKGEYSVAKIEHILVDIGKEFQQTLDDSVILSTGG